MSSIFLAYETYRICIYIGLKNFISIQIPMPSFQKFECRWIQNMQLNMYEELGRKSPQLIRSIILYICRSESWLPVLRLNSNQSEWHHIVSKYYNRLCNVRNTYANNNQLCDPSSFSFVRFQWWWDQLMADVLTKGSSVLIIGNPNQLTGDIK